MDFVGHQFIGTLSRSGRMEGNLCKFVFANGIVYEGEMNDGAFHGQGTLHFTNGSYLVGSWKQGVMEDGKYYFDKSDLEYKSKDWGYLKPEDRRLLPERNRTKDDGVIINHENQTIQQQKDGILVPLPSVAPHLDEATTTTPSSH